MASARAHYGIDAPDVVRNFAVGGMVLVATSVGLVWATQTDLVQSVRAATMWMGGTFVATALVMVWGSLVGKFHVRDKVLGAIPWTGQERVLDVGCGHGLLLLSAARRVPQGQAVGVDLWQQEDQAGNSRAATLRNAEVEGVQDRVQLVDGDMRKLPFPDASFDVAVSSWAIHNVYDAAGRAQAVQEILRVVRPGGHIALVDIRHSAEYRTVLDAAGCQDVRRAGPNFLFGIPSFVVTATRP